MLAWAGPATPDKPRPARARALHAPAMKPASEAPARAKRGERRPAAQREQYEKQVEQHGVRPVQQDVDDVVPSGAQAEDLDDRFQVFADLGLARELPGPLRPRGHLEFVEPALHVAGASGIGVVAPRAPDGAPPIQDHQVAHTRAPQFDRGGDAGETGADDYVIKPYSMVELMARARAQIRRVRPSTVGVTLEFGDIRLDPEAHRVYRGEKVLKLGPTEFRLLATFMEKPGRVWSREALLDRVWGRDVYVETRTVDVHVGRLRKALTDAGGEDPIRTVRGSGYSLG